MNCLESTSRTDLNGRDGLMAISFRPFDESGAFALTASGQNVRRLAMQGAAATMLAQLFGTGLQIVSTFVLARLVSPRDFGVVTMVTTFSLLFMNAGGNGLTEAVLQRPQVNHFLASNLF